MSNERVEYWRKKMREQATDNDNIKRRSKYYEELLTYAKKYNKSVKVQAKGTYKGVFGTVFEVKKNLNIIAIKTDNGITFLNSDGIHSVHIFDTNDEEETEQSELQ